MINVEIRHGSLLDAQWYSFGVNKAHGLRRTNEDKRKAVEGALEHAQGSGRTNEVIAAHCGVGHELVRTTRADLESTRRIGASSKRVGQDGRVYDTDKLKTAKKKSATKTTTSETTTSKTVVEAPTEADFVEEHEEPKTGYVLDGDDAVDIVKDKLGRVVPEQYAPAFQLLPPVISQIRQHLIAAQKVWKEFADKLETGSRSPVSLNYCKFERENHKCRLRLSHLTLRYNITGWF